MEMKLLKNIQKLNGKTFKTAMANHRCLVLSSVNALRMVLNQLQSSMSFTTKSMTSKLMEKLKEKKSAEPTLLTQTRKSFLNNSIKFLIIFMNTVIRKIVIAIITKIGCSTESN